MANLDRITEIKDLGDGDIKKLNKSDLIKALKTAITHIKEEPKPDSTSLTDLVECAMQRIPNREDDGMPKQCISDIVTAVVHALGPLILSNRQSEAEQLKKNIQMGAYNHDALEQYSRKENIRIHGVPEENEEDTTALAVNIMNEAVKPEDTREPPVKTFTRTDISIAHRLPSRRGSKPIMVRFVRREDKMLLMKNKGGLRRRQGPKVFITDDLTPLRNKMLQALKNDEGIARAYSLDGSIFAIEKGVNGEDGRRVKLNSPDDLYKIGWDEAKVNSHGLRLQYT